MRRAKVHIVGAGLSGLAAALRLSEAPLEIVVHEALSQVGGRRRGFVDTTLGMEFDSSVFALLRCHKAMRALIDSVDASPSWRPAAEAGAAFADLATGERWAIRPREGRLPLWLIDRRGRPPQVSLADVWALRRLAGASATASVADILPREGPAFARLTRLLALTIADAEPRQASARAVGAALAGLLDGAARASLPQGGFARAFLEPATKALRRHGVTMRFERRLTGLRFEGDRLAALEFEHDATDLGAGDCAVLALPPAAAATLVPDLETPKVVHSALVAHFACAPPPGAPEILGVINGSFHWLFSGVDRMSAIVRDAGERLTAPRETTAAECWKDVAALTGLSDAMPAWRVTPQRRAGFTPTPDEEARRPGAETPWRNLFLAGAYAQPGFLDTFEGAARSGIVAATKLAARLGARLGSPSMAAFGDE